MNQSAKASGGVGASNQELFSQRGAYLVGDPVIMAHGQANAEIRTDGGAPTLSCIHEAPIVAGSLLSGGHTNNPLDETLIAHSLRAEGFDASEDGTGRGTPLVPVYAQELADPITAHEQKTYTHEGKNNFRTRNVMAFSAKDHGADASEDLSPTLRAMPHHGSHANGGGQMAVAIPFDTTQITSPANYSKPKEGDPCDPLAAGAHPPAVAVSFQPGNIKRGAGAQPSTEVFPTLGANHGRGLSDQDPHVAYAFQPRIARNGRGDMGEVVNALTAEAGETGKGDAAPCVATVYSIMPQNSGRDYVQQHMAVRRLTPVECERLQGFPDNYTAIPWKKKPAEECPDGPRYKALGNSMAVPVMRWIGIRILEALK